MGTQTLRVRAKGPNHQQNPLSWSAQPQALEVSLAALRARFPELPEARKCERSSVRSGCAAKTFSAFSQFRPTQARLAAAELRLEGGARPFANALLQERSLPLCLKSQPLHSTYSMTACSTLPFPCSGATQLTLCSQREGLSESLQEIADIATTNSGK